MDTYLGYLMFVGINNIYTAVPAIKTLLLPNIFVFPKGGLW